MSAVPMLALLATTVLLLSLAGLAPVEARSHRAEPQEWTNATLAVQTVASSSFAQCQIHTVRDPGGKIIPDWVFFQERDHINVLVRTKLDRRFVLFRQRKYALPAESLAPVGGFIEDGESALEAAKRELREELGMRAAHWHSLGSYVTSANRGAGRVHTFFADGCNATEEGGVTGGNGDLESQRTVRLTRGALQEALLAGKIGEVKWAATIALALLSLQPSSSS